MRVVFGFIIVFILSVIFSYFQGFIDFLIQLGIFPEKYKESANFDIMMIFVLYFIFMIAAFTVGLIMWVAGLYFGKKQKRQHQKAKEKALKEFGMEAPFFYFLDPKEQGINFDKICYVYEINQAYLFEKFGDWDKVANHLGKLSNVETLKLYQEAIDYFSLPHIPKEYGIFTQFTDEELALVKIS
jgi:hypothetical protein